MISGDRRLVVGQAVDERGVGAVLEQAAHQIGEQVLVAADRRVDAARPVDACRFADDLVVERLAHAVQALELERRRPARDVGGGDGVGVVGGELRIERLLVAQQQPHAGEDTRRRCAACA